MQAWDHGLCLILIEKACHAVVALTDIIESLSDFFLPRCEMTIHKHETRIFIVKFDRYSAFIGGHTFDASFDLDCFD